MNELPEADSRPAMMSLRLDPAPGTHPGLPPFAEGEGRTPMFVPDGGERLLVLDMTFVMPHQENGWGASQLSRPALASKRVADPPLPRPVPQPSPSKPATRSSCLRRRS